MKHNISAVEFLELLKAVVKVEEIDLPVKRNQLSVMKYLTSYTEKLDTFMNISISSRWDTCIEKYNIKVNLYNSI